MKVGSSAVENCISDGSGLFDECEILWKSFVTAERLSDAQKLAGNSVPGILLSVGQSFVGEVTKKFLAES